MQTDNLKLDDQVEKKLLSSCTVGVSKLLQAILNERLLLLNLLRAFVALPAINGDKIIKDVGLSVLSQYNQHFKRTVQVPLNVKWNSDSNDEDADINSGGEADKKQI